MDPARNCVDPDPGFAETGCPFGAVATFPELAGGSGEPVVVAVRNVVFPVEKPPLGLPPPSDSDVCNGGDVD